MAIIIRKSGKIERVADPIGIKLKKSRLSRGGGAVIRAGQKPINVDTETVIGGKVVTLQVEKPKTFDFLSDGKKVGEGTRLDFVRLQSTQARSQAQRLGPTRERAEQLRQIPKEDISTAQVFEAIERGQKGERIQAGSFVSGDVIKQTGKKAKALALLSQAERKTSEKLGLKSFVSKTRQKKQEELSNLKKSIKTLEEKENKSLKDKTKLKILKVDLAGKQTIGKVGDVIVEDVLRKPIQNTALILAGFGVGKAVQTSRLGLAKLATTAPKLAKTLGVSGKLLTFGVTGAYINSVRKQAQKELKETGGITNTTANTIRELSLLGLGSKLASIGAKPVKTAKLTELRKEINKLPKSQQKILNKEFIKLEKLAAKKFVGKDIGIATRLETQQVGSKIKKGLGKKAVLKSDIVTVTKNKIFLVKKGTSPKVSRGFNVEIIGREKKQIGKTVVDQAIKVKAKAKYDAKTGKVKIQKVLSKEKISPQEANNLIDKIPKTKSVLEKVKQVKVKPSVRKISKGIKIKPFVEIKRGKIKKGFEVKAFKQDVKVKGFTRKLKDKSFVNLKKTSKKLGFGVEDKRIVLEQFKPIARETKPKKVKVSKEPTSKADELLIIGKKGVISLKKAKPISVNKVKLPVIDVKLVKGGKPTAIVPLSLQAKLSVSKPQTKKPSVISVKPKKVVISKPKATITTKLTLKPKEVSKVEPVTKIIPISKPKPASKIKPITKVKPIQVQKPKQIVKPMSAVKPAQKIKPFLRLRTKLKEFKLPKIKLPIISKLGKKFKTKPTKSKPKPIPYAFTSTIAEPSKKTQFKTRKGKLIFFSGVELRK